MSFDPEKSIGLSPLDTLMQHCSAAYTEIAADIKTGEVMFGFEDFMQQPQGEWALVAFREGSLSKIKYYAPIDSKSSLTYTIRISDGSNECQLKKGFSEDTERPGFVKSAFRVDGELSTWLIDYIEGALAEGNFLVGDLKEPAANEVVLRSDHETAEGTLSRLRGFVTRKATGQAKKRKGSSE